MKQYETQKVKKTPTVWFGCTTWCLCDVRNGVFKEILNRGVADAFKQGPITNFHQSVSKLESKNLSEKLLNMLMRPF